MSGHPNESVPLHTSPDFSNRFRISSPHYIDYAFESDVNSDTNDDPLNIQTVEYSNVNQLYSTRHSDSFSSSHSQLSHSHLDDDHVSTHPAPSHISLSDDHRSDSTSSSNESDEALSKFTNELEKPTELRDAGFIVNTRGKFLICTSCHRAILGSIAVSHAHRHKITHFKRNPVEKYIRRCGFLYTKSDLTDFLPVKCHLEFQGLPTTDGYSCTHCHYICGKESSIRQHLSDAHKNLPFHCRYKIVKVQHAYFHPNPDIFIRVQEQLNAPEATDLRTVWDNNQPDFTSLISSTDLPTRQLPPWLKKLKWHDHLKGANPGTVAELLAVVAKTSEYHMLHQALIFYLRNAMARLKDMFLQIRHLLKSITNEMADDLFKEPESDASIPAYASFFAVMFAVYRHLMRLDVPPFYYFMSPTQKQSLQTLCGLLPCDNITGLDAIHNALKSFLLYRYPANHSTLLKDPLHMFTLWRNWDRDSSFNKPGYITKDYAKIAFFTRSVILMDACFVQDAALANLDKNGGAIEDVPALDSLIEERCHFMMPGKMTPLGTVITTWLIMNQASRDEVNTPNFLFHDSLTCSFKGITVPIPKFKNMIHSQLDKARRTLHDDLFLGSYDASRFPIPSTIFDDPCNTRVDYSFLDDRRNDLQHRHKILLDTLLQSDRKEYFYRSCHGTVVWNHANCQAYLSKAQHFLQCILVAMHTTHGQPTRGVELLASTFRNLPNYSRTFMHTDDRLVNGVKVSKVESLTGHRQISPHFPPIPLSDLLLIYLIYIRPIEIMLANAMFGTEIAFYYNYYLFTGPRGQWDSHQFSNHLLAATRTHLGPNSGLKLAEVRHVTIGIYREKCGAPFKVDLQEELMESMGHLQANHGASVANDYYAVQPSEMGAISSIKFKACREYSFKVHRLWGLLDEEFDPKQDVGRSTLDTSLSPKVDTVALLTPLFAKLMQDIQTSFGEIEGRVDNVIRTSSAESATAIIQAIRNPPSAIPSYDDHPSFALLNTLRSIHPPFTAFKSEQQAMTIQALINRRHHHLIVLPTGEGKTLSWMMSVKMLQHLTTIVVIPYVALLVDCQRRLEEMNISFSTWSAANDSPIDTVVFVDTHNAVQDTFSDYLSTLLQQRRLGQVILDEAHVILTEKSFRPHLPRLRNLFSLGVPVQSLTASLPPHLESHYRAALDLSSLNMIRRQSTFDHIRIATATLSTKVERLAMLKTRLESWLPELEVIKGRGMIICRTVNDTIEVGRMLGVRPYHGQLSDTEKRQILADWLNGVFRIMVATIGCGVGIDLGDIFLIIHIGLPWNIMTYYQNIGRIRRQGIAFLIALDSERHPNSSKEEDLFGVAALRDLVFKDAYCRKLALSSFMDGKLVSCLSSKNLCDVCTKASGQPFSFILDQSTRPPRLLAVSSSSSGSFSFSSPSPPPPPSSPRRQSPIQTPAKRIPSVVSSNRSVRPRLSFTPPHDNEDPFLVHSEYSDIQPQSTSVRPSLGVIVPPLCLPRLAPDHQPTSSLSLRVQQVQSQARQSGETDFHQRVVQALGKLRGICVFCYFTEHQVRQDHQPFQCTAARPLGNYYNIMRVRNVPYFGGSSVCVKCYLPKNGFSDYQDRHGQGAGSSDKCYFAHILKPLLWISWYHPALREIVIDFFAPMYDGQELRELDHWQSYFNWCFTRGPNDSMYSQMLFVFDLLYKRISEHVPL